MGYWRKNDERYAEMHRLVEQNPGISANALAQRLGIAPSTVQRRLPSLEEAGYLLVEDDGGRLYLFEPDGEEGG